MQSDSLVLELGGHVRFPGVSLLIDTMVCDTIEHGGYCRLHKNLHLM
jgi:hypothetical protein